MSRILLRVALCFALASTSAFASIVAVGTCLPQYTKFSTITAAINAVPAGSTIFVCPGTYPEQLLITRNLTIKGAANGTLGAAILTIPAGGPVANPPNQSASVPIVAQIAVEGVTTANIGFLTVDGAGNNIQTCSLDLVGVYFHNSSGTITKNSVTNQIQPPDFAGCQGGLGIFATSDNGGTSKVTISGNYVHNYQKNGITAHGSLTTATIASNIAIGNGPTTGAAQNSIEVAFGAQGSVTSNTVGDSIWAPDTNADPGDAAAGILVFGSTNITIASNIVNSTQFGISVNTDLGVFNGDGNTIKSNKISTTQIFDGIDLCSNNNSVTGNVITGSDEAAVHYDDTCTGTSESNTVTGNTISAACTAFLFGAGTNPSGTNTVYNVSHINLSGGFASCTPPGLGALYRTRAHPKPFRP